MSDERSLQQASDLSVDQPSGNAMYEQHERSVEEDNLRPVSGTPSRHIEDAALLLGLNGSAPNGHGFTPFTASLHDFHPGDAQVADLGFPDFFEQIMMPNLDHGMQANTMRPPNVSDLTQDMTFDAVDFDFSYLASGLTRPSTAQGYQEAAVPLESTTRSDAQLRSEAFKRSPWSWNHWIPERNSHAFSGQDQIDVREDRVSATDQLTSPGTLRFAHSDIDQTARDRMIRLVTQVAEQRLAVPSFPSLELLEDLVDIFLVQDGNSIDSYVHAASFDCKQTRTELLLAMVAAGARYIALAPVWKMGLVLQEIVRLATGEAFERDNSTTRELSMVQAYLIWLNIGAYSGFRRQTEIAVSFLQPAVTMLVWSDAFSQFRYRTVIPQVEDSDTVLVDKWRAWVEQEGLKRLIIHTFLHDSQVAITNLKAPLLSAAQMELPLPAGRELWLAPNAHAWRHAYLNTVSLQQAELPSMVEFFGNVRMLDQLDKVVDRPLCLLTSCHGLGHEVWQYRQQQRLLLKWQNQGRRDRWLAHQTTQRDIYDDLKTLQAYSEVQSDVSLEIMFTLELLMMSLHVDLHDIQVFSGKSGEEEARKVFPRIRAWTQSSESRVAVWHAGQVLSGARRFEKTKLRDFYAVAFYHSALTLWVYGMVTSNTSRHSGFQTPFQGSPRYPGASLNNSETSHADQRILVDTNDEKAAKAFTLLGQGTPGVQNLQQSTFIPLTNSRGLMSTAEAVLKSNFPHSSNGLPPLVENLANLLGELGKFSGKE